MKTASLHGCIFVWLCVCLMLASRSLSAEANPPPPRITSEHSSNGLESLIFPYPAAAQYEVLSTRDFSQRLVPDQSSGFLSGPSFVITNRGPSRFYSLRVTPMSPENLLAATVLNRLCYGPSPEDLDRIRAIGAGAFVTAQESRE